jgi:tetratricopeptide (TPR) repeat protein
MAFIKTGERIKYYRNLLHLTQKELAMGRVTSEMIHLLENDKKKLTPITANILVSNFHKIANEKGVQINLEMKDFLMSDNEYANSLCNKWIMEIEENSFGEEKCFKIIELAKEYNLNDILFKTYEKMSIYYYYEKKYSIALKYLEELLPISLLLNYKNEKVNIFNRIASCCYMLLDYDKAFYYYKTGYEEFLKLGIIDSVLEDKLLYNLTLINFEKKNYIDAEMYAEKLLALADIEESEKYTNLILKANVYMKTDRVQGALEMYKEILNHDIKYLYLVQHNMAVAFLRLGKLDESIEYFSRSINNQLLSLSPFTTSSLMHIADIYYEEKRYDEAITFYEYGLNNANKFHQLDELILCYENIYKVCSEASKIKKFDSYYKSMVDLYTNITLSEEQLNRVHTIEHNYISNIDN